VVAAADALTGASGIGVKKATSGPHDLRAYVIFPAIPERQLRAAHRPGSSRTDKGRQTKRGEPLPARPQSFGDRAGFTAGERCQRRE
jgi:hypothetical protein